MIVNIFKDLNNIKNYLILCIFIPIFFTINDGFYNANLIDTSGSLDLFTKPLPISVILCPVILLLSFKNNNINSKIFFLFLILVSSIFILNISFLEFNSIKLKYFLQMIFPISGLFIGFNSEKINLKILFYFITVFIVFQLGVTLLSGYILIRANLIFFTVYQNLQYVSTTIIIIGFIIVLSKENKISKTQENLFIILLTIYASLSFGFSNLIIYFFGISVFFLFKRKVKLKYFLFIILSFFLILNSISKINLKSNVNKFQHDRSYKPKQIDKILNLEIPNNIQVRINILMDFFEQKFKIEEIFIGKKNLNFFLQHNSSHNYFLDTLLINGIFFPIIVMILIFCLLIYNCRRNNNIFFLSIFFFIFAILIENSFKVAMRQPYSGLITYFFLGYFYNSLFAKKF